MVEIIAHRGASEDAPENTLAAVQLAWEQNADAVEIDIRLSRDGFIVLHHDETTGRTAGLERFVADQTLDELRRLDAGAWKDARFRGERIPTLGEVLETVPAGKRLFIEVKCGPEIIPPLEQALARHANSVAVIAFSQATLGEIKKALPHVTAYLLSGFHQDSEPGALLPTATDLIRTAKTAGFDGVNLSHNGPINAAFAQEVKDADLSLYVWTVDLDHDARRLIAAGVDGITTNRPGWLREQTLAR